MQNLSQSGQVVVMLLLLMVVVLTVGLSIAARSTSDVNISTLGEQSARAFSAAEAGLEEALKDPSQAALLSGSGLNNTIGEAKFSVKQVAQTPSIFAFPGGVPRDDPAQVWLSNYPTLNDLSMSGKNVRIYWGKDTINYNCNSTGPIAPALEYIYVYETNSGYSSLHGFYDPCGGSRSGATGFVNVNPQITTLNTNLGEQTYKYQTPEIILTGNPKLLRIRLLYNESAAPVAVASTSSGINLPQQGSLLESTGEFGESKRKIQVFRSYPKLPGIFDYVLFAGGNITK